jgi:hypothetical protein
VESDLNNDEDKGLFNANGNGCLPSLKGGDDTHTVHWEQSLVPRYTRNPAASSGAKYRPNPAIVTGGYMYIRSLSGSPNQLDSLKSRCKEATAEFDS